MSRYFTKAAYVGSPDPEDAFYPMNAQSGATSMTVHEDELETWTGLYNAQGEEIHRTERVALGFKAEK